MKKNLETRSTEDFDSLISDERGMSTIEYVVLLVCVCAGCLGLWAAFGEDVYEKLDNATGTFEDEVVPQGSDD